MIVASFPVTPWAAVTGVPAATRSGGHSATHAEEVHADIPPWSALKRYRVRPEESARTVPDVVCERVTVELLLAASAEPVVLGELELDVPVDRAEVDELHAETMTAPVARTATTAPK
jgi:hypothetical protein